jgi:RNA polymerase sigma factor (sigma-70 family)
MVQIEGLAAALIHLLFFAFVLLRPRAAPEGPGEDAAFFATRYDEKRPKRPGGAHGGGGGRGRGPIDKDRAHELVFRRSTMSLVWDWLARLGVPPCDRRDKTQDVFLSAHRSWHTYDPRKALPWRWLNQIAVHVASHYLGEARHRREVVAEDEGIDCTTIPDDDAQPDEKLHREEEQLLVLDTLVTLDGAPYSVLLAHDIDEAPMVEVAEQNGIPLSTAYKIRARGMKCLAEAMKLRRGE